MNCRNKYFFYVVTLCMVYQVVNSNAPVGPSEVILGFHNNLNNLENLFKHATCPLCTVTCADREKYGTDYFSQYKKDLSTEILNTQKTEELPHRKALTSLLHCGARFQGFQLYLYMSSTDAESYLTLASIAGILSVTPEYKAESLSHCQKYLGMDCIKGIQIKLTFSLGDKTSVINYAKTLLDPTQTRPIGIDISKAETIANAIHAEKTNWAQNGAPQVENLILTQSISMIKEVEKKYYEKQKEKLEHSLNNAGKGLPALRFLRTLVLELTDHINYSASLVMPNVEKKNVAEIARIIFYDKDPVHGISQSLNDLSQVYLDTEVEKLPQPSADLMKTFICHV